MTSGSVDGLFGILAQTNNFMMSMQNSVIHHHIDQINRDFDPHTKQDLI
jgi:hypothetical protein